MLTNRTSDTILLREPCRRRGGGGRIANVLHHLEGQAEGAPALNAATGSVLTPRKLWRWTSRSLYVGHVPTAMEGLIHGGGAPARTPVPTISPGDDSTSHSDSTQPEDRVGTVSAVGRAFQYTPATVAHAPSCSRDRTGSFVRFPDAKTGEAVQYQASKGSVSEYKGVKWRSTANHQHLISFWTDLIRQAK